MDRTTNARTEMLCPGPFSKGIYSNGDKEKYTQREVSGFTHAMFEFHMYKKPNNASVHIARDLNEDGKYVLVDNNKKPLGSKPGTVWTILLKLFPSLQNVYSEWTHNDNQQRYEIIKDSHIHPSLRNSKIFNDLKNYCPNQQDSYVRHSLNLHFQYTSTLPLAQLQKDKELIGKVMSDCNITEENAKHVIGVFYNDKNANSIGKVLEQLRENKQGIREFYETKAAIESAKAAQALKDYNTPAIDLEMED